MKIYYNPKLKQLARNLRNNSTPSEVILWNKLKRRQLCGYQFMRQKPIGNYIVDFFCSKLRLIIEVDGEIHRFKIKEDAERQQWLEDLGLSVLRFDNDLIRKDVSSVVYSIESWIKQHEDGIQPP